MKYLVIYHDEEASSMELREMTGDETAQFMENNFNRGQVPPTLIPAYAVQKILKKKPVKGAE